jgi:hypothetical protein
MMLDDETKLLLEIVELLIDSIPSREDAEGYWFIPEETKEAERKLKELRNLIEKNREDAKKIGNGCLFC